MMPVKKSNLASNLMAKQAKRPKGNLSFSFGEMNQSSGMGKSLNTGPSTHVAVNKQPKVSASRPSPAKVTHRRPTSQLTKFPADFDREYGQTKSHNLLQSQGQKNTDISNQVGDYQDTQRADNARDSHTSSIKTNSYSASAARRRGA